MGSKYTKRLPKDSVTRFCAFACLGEAIDRLRATPSSAPGGDVAYGRRLARVLNALCDHYGLMGVPGKVTLTRWTRIRGSSGPPR